MAYTCLAISHWLMCLSLWIALCIIYCLWYQWQRLLRPNLPCWTDDVWHPIVKHSVIQPYCSLSQACVYYYNYESTLFVFCFVLKRVFCICNINCCAIIFNSFFVISYCKYMLYHTQSSPHKRFFQPYTKYKKIHYLQYSRFISSNEGGFIYLFIKQPKQTNKLQTVVCWGGYNIYFIKK